MDRADAVDIPHERFSHEALLYRGHDDRVDQLTAFVREGLRLGETPCLVVDDRTIGDVTAALGRDASRVRFADMRIEGRNPGRLISVWTDLVGEVTSQGGAIRGVGEPIWAARTADELLECARHEALLNLAFDDGPAWRLACPYDVSELPSHLVDQARRNHPMLTSSGTRDRSARYRSALEGPSQLTDALPDAPSSAASWQLSLGVLAVLRRAVTKAAREAGIGPDRAADLALALDEVATNSIEHARGGVARVWTEYGTVFAETEDEGMIEDPLAGRRRPAAGSSSGFGLWLAHQLCDLVQVRTTPTGTLVRLRIAR